MAWKSAPTLTLLTLRWGATTLLVAPPQNPTTLESTLPLLGTLAEASLNVPESLLIERLHPPPINVPPTMSADAINTPESGW